MFMHMTSRTQATQRNKFRNVGGYNARFLVDAIVLATMVFDEDGFGFRQGLLHKGVLEESRSLGILEAELDTELNTC